MGLRIRQMSEPVRIDFAMLQTCLDRYKQSGEAHWLDCVQAILSQMDLETLKGLNRALDAVIHKTD